MTAVLQVAVIAVLVWVYLTGDHDASATTVDWAFVWLIIATPTLLAASFLLGRLVRRRTAAPSSRLERSVAWTVQATTLLLLVLTGLTAPLEVLMSIFVEPIG